MITVTEVSGHAGITESTADVAGRLGQLWHAIPPAERIAAIEFFVAEVPERDDYDPELDGYPRGAVERLAKRLHMRPVFLLRDRRRAAKMLEQYGHQSFGAVFTLRVARAYLKQQYPDEFAAAEPLIRELVVADGELSRDLAEMRAALSDVRRELRADMPDDMWELLVRSASVDLEWQAIVSRIRPRAAEVDSSIGGADPRIEGERHEAIEREPAYPAAEPTPIIEMESAVEPLTSASTDVSASEQASEVATAEPSERSNARDAEADAELSAVPAGADQGLPPTPGEVLEEAGEQESEEPAFEEPQHRLTGLDRAIMDFILATATGTPGAKPPEEVLKACDEWSRLSTYRVQSYYCLGLAHGLLDASIDGFARTEMNEARSAWYAAGRVAAIQRRQDRETLMQFLGERTKPLAALLGTQVAVPQVGTRGAARQLLRQSLDFLADCNCWGAMASITRCAGPYLDFFLLEDLYRHTSDLVATQRPIEGEALLRVVLSADVPCPGELRARFRRRRAQVLAQQGKVAAAIDEFEDLTGCGHPDVEARAVIDLSLLQAGLTSAAQIHLPEGKSTRQELLRKFETVADSVRLALTGIPEDGGAVARADGLSFMAVVEYLRWAGHGGEGARPTADRALQAVEAALLAVPKASVENQYRLGGTLGLLLTIEAVLCFERADVERAMAAWRRVPHETGRLPLDDLHALVETAVIVDPPSAESIVDSILRHRPPSEVRAPDEEWLAASGNLRRRHLETIDTLILKADERLKLHEALLAAARRANDREIALRSLDAIYRLGVHEGQADAALLRLAQQSSWDGLWTRAEANEALADLCIRRRQKDEALQYLEDSFEAAMLDDDADYAAALLGRMQEIGLSEDEHRQRVARLPSTDSETATLKGAIAKQVGRRIRIAFVGGDERQAQYDGEVREMLREELEEMVEVQFIHPGWSSNWGRGVDDVARQCGACDAVVLMRFMRTMMGRTLRERLTIPWVSCAGHGKKSMYLSILKATQVVVQQRSRSTRVV